MRYRVTYTIKSQSGIELYIFGTSGFGQAQVLLTPTPDPNFGLEAYLPDGTQGTFLVDITGSFTATGSANGSSPDSEGVSLQNLAGTSFDKNSDTRTQALAVTVAVPVPEPTTAALATLAVAALLLQGRRLPNARYDSRENVCLPIAPLSQGNPHRRHLAVSLSCLHKHPPVAGHPQRLRRQRRVGRQLPAALRAQAGVGKRGVGHEDQNCPPPARQSEQLQRNGSAIQRRRERPSQ